MDIAITKKDDEELNISVNGVNIYSLAAKKETVTDTENDLVAQFQAHRGETEYTGIVETIQKWYYGSLVKASWCATSLSYFADQIGILKYIGGKAENVYQMYLNCKKTGKGQMFEKGNIPEIIKRNDILFWLWEGDKMTSISSKHVGVCEIDTKGQQIYCIGGNQKDKICTLKYDREYLYAVYRL